MFFFVIFCFSFFFFFFCDKENIYLQCLPFDTEAMKKWSELVQVGVKWDGCLTSGKGRRIWSNNLEEEEADIMKMRRLPRKQKETVTSLEKKKKKLSRFKIKYFGGILINTHTFTHEKKNKKSSIIKVSISI